jgi:hypothetical protein
MLASKTKKGGGVERDKEQTKRTGAGMGGVDRAEPEYAITSPSAWGSQSTIRQRTERWGTTYGSLLEGNSLLLTHSGNNSDVELIKERLLGSSGNQVEDGCSTYVLAVVKVGLDLLAKFALGDLDVVLAGTILGHQVEETVVDVDELVFSSADVGDLGTGEVSAKRG